MKPDSLCIYTQSAFLDLTPVLVSKKRTASRLLGASREMMEKVCKQPLRLWLPPASSCMRALGLRSHLCSSARNSRWEWSEHHNLTFFFLSAVRIESRDLRTLGELSTTFYKLEIVSSGEKNMFFKG